MSRWPTRAAWRVVSTSVLTLGLAACDQAQTGLLRARISANEASAIASLRMITVGQVMYSAECAAGGYAITLEDLSKPKPGAQSYIGADLVKNGVTKSGYRISLARDTAKGVTDVGTAASTCNHSTATPASSYFAIAEPVTPGTTGVRYFAIDARAIVFASANPITNPIVESAAVKPVQ